MRDTPKIKAIETRYAGHRFRSRLEARWAVFFDALNIEWQYEAQGFMVGQERRPYLPDFLLPDWGLWVEVKGHHSGLDLELIAKAVEPASGLPSMGREQGARLLLLGSIPLPGESATHSVIYFVDGALCRLATTFSGDDDNMVAGWSLRPFSDVQPANLLVPECRSLLPEDSPVTKAYRAARSARFEHGESGRQESTR